MHLTEIFSSLQGEGRFTGTPSLFIRTGRCPYRCRWCDTPASRTEQGSDFSVPQIMPFVERQAPLTHVVITGGEPLMEKHLAALTSRLLGMGKFVTIETSGFLFRPIPCNLVSISPKLASAGLSAAPPVPSVRRWLKHADYQIKFVVEQEKDMQEIYQFLQAVECHDRGKIYLMPQARTRQEMLFRGPLVADLCVRYGYQYSPRLHIDLYGGRRGT